MLTDLTIKNVAIINTLQIAFKPGLTVLTGETGAGKSIIIDAVGLIMGGRASAELIRSGEEEAVVEAMFDISDEPEIRQLLIDSGLECENDLLIKRSISRSGKNRIFINGGMTTLSILSDIACRLINIYGQHESQTLLRPENQLMLLDAFAGTNQMREDFSQAFRRLQSIREKRDSLDEYEREAARKFDLLSFQSQEIEDAQLKPGEDEDLEERRHLLANSEKLCVTSSDAFERLYGGDGAILGQLRRISLAINDIATIDHTLDEVSSSLENAYLQLEDTSISLRDYSSRIESDPTALQSINDRLDLISKLNKKYGPTVNDVLTFKQKIDNDLEFLNLQKMDRNKLELEYSELETALRARGKELTVQRTSAALSLKSALEAEAHQLAMKNAIIEIVIIPLEEPRPNGFERIEFLFSPNPGEIPRPLAKIASGGELSRLMLAIKQVLPEGDVLTLIFDEVDTGIGGATSELVGRKLKKVADSQQVLCITHLPQVAVFADQQLLVEKLISDGRTATRVIELDQDERTREIARMLAGATVTDSAMKHAAEMLQAGVKA